MTVHINKGWLYATNSTDSMKVYFKECEGFVMLDPFVKHYEGGINLSYDLSKLWLELKVKDVYFDSYSDYETFMKYLIAWQQANTLEIGIYRDSSSNLIEFKGDGNGTTFTMVIPQRGIGPIIKKSMGDQQVYVIKTLRFIEGG